MTRLSRTPDSADIVDIAEVPASVVIVDSAAVLVSDDIAGSAAVMDFAVSSVADSATTVVLGGPMAGFVSAGFAIAHSGPAGSARRTRAW